MNTILIAGCGRLGQRVAKKELQAGNRVYGLCRRPESGAGLAKSGIEPIVWDVDAGIDANINTSMDTGIDPGVDTGVDPDKNTSCWPESAATESGFLYYLLAPPSTGETDQRIARFFAGLANSQEHGIKHALLISTTGVYGDCQGDWVDETRAPNPGVDRARRRLDSERVFSQWAQSNKVNSVILRVPGIYSAARLPLARVKNKTPVLDPDLAPYSNRIHEADLSAIMFAAIRTELNAEIINVADDEPSSMSDYFLQIARVFALPTPPIIDKTESNKLFSAEMMSYLNESRRISNRKMKQLLGYKLQYPTLKSGLQQCLAEKNQDRSHNEQSNE